MLRQDLQKIVVKLKLTLDPRAGAMLLLVDENLVQIQVDPD